MTDLKSTVDKIGYETISQTQPGVIAAINAALAAGGSARAIERDIRKKFGPASVTAALVISAAYYLEAQKANPQ
jgi:hypothetical protein